jgi:hypothetical protein
MSTGGVLMASTKSYLINEGLKPKDIGLYNDTVRGQWVLTLKKLGHSLPISKFDYVLSKHDAGAFKTLMVTLNNTAPESLHNFDYGIKIRSQVENPGVRNSEMYGRIAYYGGVMPAVQLGQDGLITPAQMKEMEKSIVDQINGYIPTHGEGLLPAHKATKIFIIDQTAITGVATVSINYKGVTHLIESVSTKSVVPVINSTLSGLRACYLSSPTAAHKIAIWSDKGEDFDVIAGDDTELLERGIMVQSRTMDFTISVETDVQKHSVKGINYARFVAIDASDKYEFKFQTIGATATIRKNSPTGANAAFTFVDSYQKIGGTVWYVTKINDYEIMGVSFGQQSYVYNELPATYDLTLGTANGSFPRLTDGDVFREFAHNPNFGKLSAMTWREVAIKGMKYAKITMKSEMEIGALAGANRMDSRRNSVSIYVPLTTIHTKVFDSASPNSDLVSNPDLSLIGLLDLAKTK